MLLAGDNFGCGSSREHAPWALVGWGIRAVISTSFADIFRNNALKNSLLPVVVDADVHTRLFDAGCRRPMRCRSPSTWQPKPAAAGRARPELSHRSVLQDLPAGRAGLSWATCCNQATNRAYEQQNACLGRRQSQHEHDVPCMTPPCEMAPSARVSRYSVEDKLKIARRLDEFGVHYIEGGWPGSNPKDAAFFQRARQLKLQHAKIAAFGFTAEERRPAGRRRQHSDPAGCGHARGHPGGQKLGSARHGGAARRPGRKPGA